MNSADSFAPRSLNGLCDHARRIHFDDIVQMAAPGRVRAPLGLISRRLGHSSVYEFTLKNACNETHVLLRQTKERS